MSASHVFGALMLVLLTGLIVWVAPSQALRTHELEATIGTGELFQPAGLAVDGTTGDLYVADLATSTVTRYDAAGALAEFAGTGSAQLGPFAFPEGTSQLAVDDKTGTAAEGDLYVVSGGELLAYDAEGNPAPFTATSSYVSGNALTGSPSGPFGRTAAVAVDSEGDIYVSESSNGTLVFNAQGKYLTSVGVGASTSTGLAMDSSGAVIAGGAIGTPDSYPPTAGTTYTYAVPSFDWQGAAAADPADDDLYIGVFGAVGQYSSVASDNSRLNEFAQAQLSSTTAPAGLAVAGPGSANAGDVYMATGGQVYRYGPLVTVPDAVTEPATGVDSVTGTATLHGTVDPQGIETTGCTFEYGSGAAFTDSIPCAETPGDIGSGTDPVPVEAELAGLAPGRYRFRLHATNGDGGTRGAEQIFAIIAAPTVEAQSAEPGATEARLAATIDPNSSRTSYRFEYGTTAAYGSSTQNGVIAAGTAPVEVGLGVVGLQPDTTYHFRVVASNGFGTSIGADSTFTTGRPGSSACPNEAFRVGPAAELPECRAYEMVSPPDKNGGGILTTLNVQAAPDGDAIQFLSTSTFAGSKAGSGIGSYLATRTGGAWSTEAIDAPQLNAGGFVELTSIASSEDLNETLQLSLEALTPGAIQGGSNLYLRDNSTGALKLIAAVPGGYFFLEMSSSVESHYLDGTPNWSSFYFFSNYALAPGAHAGSANVYEYSNGELKVYEGPRPGGEKPYFGPEETVLLESTADLGYQFVSSPKKLTADATEAPPGAANIYAWHEGQFKLVGQTEPGTVEEQRLPEVYASPNGLYFAFASYSAMTPSDRPSAACTEATGPAALHCRDVYLFEYETGKLTCVSCDGPGNGNSELGTEEQKHAISGHKARAVLNDGTVFFNTPNRLVTRDSNGVGDVYRWHQGRTDLISTGTSPQASRFADADVNGEDIFFFTSQQLVGQDRDQRVDLYDAKVDGGLAGQYPAVGSPPCEGDGCRGGQASTPLPSPIGSGGASGGSDRCAALTVGAKQSAAKVRRLGRRVKTASGKHRTALHRRLVKERKRAKAQSARANICRRNAK